MLTESESQDGRRETSAGRRRGVLYVHGSWSGVGEDDTGYKGSRVRGRVTGVVGPRIGPTSSVRVHLTHKTPDDPIRTHQISGGTWEAPPRYSGNPGTRPFFLRGYTVTPLPVQTRSGFEPP